MKYLVTAAMALALTGTAASALADTPDDHHRDEHRAPAAHAPTAHTPAVKRDVVRNTVVRNNVVRNNDVRNRQQTLNREDTRLHTEQRAVNNSDARLRNDHTALVRENFDFHSHALRDNDRGRAYYDANVYQREYRPSFRFQFGDYGYPGGWYARSWNYGDRLPFGWFAPAYYLNWGSYRLAPPPIGCEWVREGSDAVLVNVWTGQVLSVYRGIFY